MGVTLLLIGAKSKAEKRRWDRATDRGDTWRRPMKTATPHSYQAPCPNTSTIPLRYPTLRAAMVRGSGSNSKTSTDT